MTFDACELTIRNKKTEIDYSVQHRLRKRMQLIMNGLRTLLFFTTITLFQIAWAKPIIIAHRGASGYLPEHSLEAKVLAFAQGADFIEQDLVMTKDNEIVVLHEHYLNRVTDVAQKYPGRARDDGKYYVIDFTLEELRQLRITNGYKGDPSGQPQPEWPERFPVFQSRFSIHTFAEEIELIQGLNALLDQNIGIYPEIKSPWFHRQEGKDISQSVLAILKQYGYDSKKDPIFIQSFDPNELLRIDRQLLPKMQMDIPLVQLIAETSWLETYELNGKGEWQPYDYQWMFEKGAMARISDYAEGIGPWKPFIIKETSTAKDIQVTPMVRRAHAAGLVVHPYTFRADTGRIPSWAHSFETMVKLFVEEAKIDGFFTDFPDRARKAIE